MIHPIEIPTYFTYGRTGRTDDFGFAHIEKVMDRRSLHNGQVAAHKHAKIVQLCLWTSGTGRYAVDDVAFSFTAPMFIFIPTHVVHGFDVVAGSDAIVFSLRADEMDSSPFFNNDVYRRALILNAPDSPAPTSLIINLMESGYARYRQGAATAQRVIRGVANAILAEAASLLGTDGRCPGENVDPRIVDLVERHFRAPWSVADYARELGCTPYQINALTRASFGQSLKRLIFERRLLESKRLLAFTVRPIEVIAAEVGIPDPAYFSRFFHTLTGISPREWRRRRLERNDGTPKENSRKDTVL